MQGYNYDAYDAILHSIFKQTQGDAWFKPSDENVSCGVAIRTDSHQFRCFPYENEYLAPFLAATMVLNPVVAVKTRSAAVHAALAIMGPDERAIQLDSNTKIQVLETMSFLPRADKEQGGAFIRDEAVLVVWADNVDGIIPLCRELEEKLIKLVWKARARTIAPSVGPSSTTNPSVTSITSPEESSANLNEKTGVTEQAAIAAREQRASATKSKSKKWSFGWKLSKAAEPEVSEDPEKVSVVEKRRIPLLAPFYGGLGGALSIFFIGSGLSILLAEYRADGNAVRFALLATAPLLIAVSLFFSLQLVTGISYIIGPVAHYHENTKYYSAVKPKPNLEVDSHLGHITIELPVYKESLEATIAPSVYSIKKAMQTYARQGGTSSIFVHDDGLQLLSPEDREERIAFYATHNIGWVARPKHSNEDDGFKRAGRFKKASNMNFGIILSMKMEKHIAALEAAGEDDDIEGVCLEERALALAVEEMYAETGNRFKPWACNARSLRMGDVILIVDSDTIVPEDCFRDAVRELAECPEVAIIQHESDVMQVAFHYFENGIAHFTRRINKCISMGCANGEVAPFVGHNAFLRWSALQDAAFIDAADNKSKIWSESNVSEDFDMALRLQLKGYSIRWATYSEGGFKEGVSLSVDDELNRWQKYAYGCNELIFNPLITWWKLGPINKQLRTFVWSDAPVHYKITMMSYMFSYYGIAASAALSVLNYVLLGFAFEVDGFFMHSFEVFLACTVVFPGLGNVAVTILDYRLGHRSIISAFFENIMWAPFFFFFFGGLSVHLSTALLAHLFSYNITWGATIKEVERSNFFIEVPRILKRFWVVFLMSTVVIAAIVIMSTELVPLEWRVEGSSWSVIFPLALVAGQHILFPIALNPYLMVFSY